MIAWLPVVAAFGVVAGCLSFIAHCSAALDEEDRGVREAEKRRPTH